MRRLKKVKLVDAGMLSNWLVGRRLRAAGPHLAGQVLDFACGHGQLAQLCDPRAYLGYDSDSRKISVARQNFPGYRFQSVLPEDERFDTIAALAFIEHVRPEPYLRQFANLLRPGGRIVLTTPHPSFEWIHTAGSKLRIFSSAAHDEHENLFSPGSMTQLAEAIPLDLTASGRFLLGANQLFVLSVR